MPLSLPVAVGVDVQYFGLLQGSGLLSRLRQCPQLPFPRTDSYDDFRI